MNHYLLALLLSFSPLAAYIEEMDNAPLILSNYDKENNSLQGSVYELLECAEEDILMLSFTFDDAKVIDILNEKAKAGIAIHLLVDVDHLKGLKEKLHTSIRLSTRDIGEGHLHHKILVTDFKYIWIGSANFTSGSLAQVKNLSLGFKSVEIAQGIHQEASDIANHTPRDASSPLKDTLNKQALELYILPHNDPLRPAKHESSMNSVGEQKIISLIDNAKTHIQIYMDVWTYKDAARAIIRAKERGVTVDIAVSDKTSDAVWMMLESGIPIGRGTQTHYKFMLVDRSTFLNGSPNWSMNAFSRNDESFTVLYNLTEEELEALEGPLSMVSS